MPYEQLTFSLPDVALRGRLYLPETDGPHPVVLAHSGIGSVAEGIYDLAPLFTDAGLGVLFYDHRGFGYSDGEPRQEIDPIQFSRDERDVITLLGERDDVDEQQISLWGISLGGLVSLLTAGTDRRVASVVAVVPPISGFSARGLFPTEALEELDSAIEESRRSQLNGGDIPILQTSGERVPGGPAVMFDDPDGVEFTLHYRDLPSFRNELTLSSLGRLFETEALPYAARITAPLFLVLASDDTVAPVADAREFYRNVRGEKQLEEHPGQHYGILLHHYKDIVARSARWVAAHSLAAASR